MTIQECIFMIGSICFIFALIPSIFNPEGKPDTFTSAFTGLILSVFGATYMTMNFYFAGAVTFVTAACWFILLAQVRYRKANPEFYDGPTLPESIVEALKESERAATSRHLGDEPLFDQMDKNTKKKVEQDAS